MRKPWAESTPSVMRYLTTVAAAGVDVRTHKGRDDQGRQIIEFIAGPLAMDAALLDLDGLVRVGAIIRSIHDASLAFDSRPEDRWDTLIPAPEDELICHNDLTPWNLVLGERWVFIDWDGAAPSSRIWDLAYSAQAFTLADPDEDPASSASRLAALIDGYGADDAMRAALPETMPLRTAAMHDVLRDANRSGFEPWGTLYVTGHGEYWTRAARYVDTYRHVWASALSA